MSAGIVGVLLAAGSSSRFGADKLLHLLDDGTAVAQRSARALHTALPTSVAVVQDVRSELASRLRDEGLRTVACPSAAAGMGASLAAGVAAEPGAAGWVIALADMPFVAPQSIAAVADALRQGAAIAAPQHCGRRGHPVGFARRFRDDLLALSGDSGARGLLAAYAEQLVALACDDPGVLLDIDAPADLDAAKQRGAF